jgi:hypothetical protein
MEQIAAIIFVSLTLVDHSKIFGFCLVIWICIRIRSTGYSFGTMAKSVLAFCISGTLLIGLPLTVAKMCYPELATPKAEAGAIKEVAEWFGH